MQINKIVGGKRKYAYIFFFILMDKNESVCKGKSYLLFFGGFQ